MTIYVVEMNEWGCWLYGGVGNLLTFVSFCDKSMGVLFIYGIKVPYLPEYNAHFFLTNFASKIEMHIIHGTFCFHVR